MDKHRERLWANRDEGTAAGEVAVVRREGVMGGREGGDRVVVPEVPTGQALDPKAWTTTLQPRRPHCQRPPGPSGPCLDPRTSGILAPTQRSFRSGGLGAKSWGALSAVSPLPFAAALPAAPAYHFRSITQGFVSGIRFQTNR